MKPDKFDETIRQKLEGIQPHFEENDWAKFRTYQAIHVPQSFIQRFGRTMLYTAASVAGGLMVFANVYQYRQNQSLDRQLQEAKVKMAQKEEKPAQMLGRIDTVYITKYITLKHSENNQYDEAVPSINKVPSASYVLEDENKANEAQKVILNTANRFEEQPAEEETNKRNTPLENIQDEVIRQPNFSKQKATQRRLTEKQATNLLPLQNQNKAQNATNHLIGSEAGASENDAIIQREERNETVAGMTTNNLTLSVLEPNQIVSELMGITPAEVKVQRYGYAYQSVSSNAAAVSSKETKTTMPPISLKGMKLRVGAGLNLGDKYTARSLNASVLLGKYWSIDVGLSKAHISGPEFYTEDVFKVKTKKDFETWHKDRNLNPPQLVVPQVFDIRTSVSLVRMPIGLTYRWPIKDGFTLLMSGGTNLNLSAEQAYKFFTRERTGELIERSGEFDIKTSLGADALIAAGIEKQWRQLVFQGEAYAAPYFQKPTYLTENRNIGVRFRVLYQFGKK